MFFLLLVYIYGQTRLHYPARLRTRVMILEVFILGGQRIDQKRKKGWWRGRREKIDNGSRERIEIERKETKGN